MIGAMERIETSGRVDSRFGFGWSWILGTGRNIRYTALYQGSVGVTVGLIGTRKGG